MKRLFFSLIPLLLLIINIQSQTLNETHQKIRAAVEAKEFANVVNLLDAFEKSDKKAFEANNYDYLSARMSEKNDELAAAMAKYQAVVNRNSVLKPYALWHLSQIARSTGNLMLERTYLEEIQVFAPDSLMSNAVKTRLARSFFEGGNYDSAIKLLNAQLSDSNSSTGGANINKSVPIEKTPAYRETLSLLALSFLQSGNTNSARDAFLKIINNLPNPSQPDDFALTAIRNLDAMDGGKENAGKTAPDLPDAEHLRRGFIYQFNRDFADARLHYQAIVQNYPNSPNVPDAMFQTGRGFVQEGNFNEAIVWFERVQEQFPASPSAKDALSQAASAYSRVNKPKEAMSRYQKYIAQYPDAENLERPYLNIVDIERDLGEDGDALKWTMKTQDAFRGKLGEALALFAQMRIHITQNDWQTAATEADKLLTFADLGGTRVPGGTNKAEITFLKAYALEKLGKYAEAIDVYLSIPDGRGEYYGWRSTERLKALANAKNDSAQQKFNVSYAAAAQTISAANAETVRINAESAMRLIGDAENNDEIPAGNMTKKEILSGILRQAYALLPNYKQIPNFKLLEFGRKEVLMEKSNEKAAVSNQNIHQTLANELLFLNLYDEGTPELEASLMENGKWKVENGGTSTPGASGDLAYTLAVFYKRGEMANRAVAFAEPLWKNVPADYQLELIPRDWLELLYPAPYADSLTKFATARNVDPRFLLSIMRQESRYRADVKSYAAARGLMQFISSTANKTASELKIENFKQDALYNPPTAVLFGSQYLSDLFAQFPNQPPAVAASYNGGEDNMKRWFGRAKSDEPDRYVSEILFSQSKDYVYKVMANYRVYQSFYDEKLLKKIDS